MNIRFFFAILGFCVVTLAFAPNQTEQCCSNLLQNQPTSEVCENLKLTRPNCQPIVDNFSRAAQAQSRKNSQNFEEIPKQKKNSSLESKPNEVKQSAPLPNPKNSFSSQGDLFQIFKIFFILIFILVFFWSIFKFSFIRQVLMTVIAFFSACGVAVVVTLIFAKLVSVVIGPTLSQSLALFLVLTISACIGFGTSGYYFFKAIRRPETLFRYILILLSIQILFWATVIYLRLEIP